MDGDSVDGPTQFTDSYMVWYRRITILYVGDPTRPPLQFGYHGVGLTVELLVNYLLFILYYYMSFHNFLYTVCLIIYLHFKCGLLAIYTIGLWLV